MEVVVYKKLLLMFLRFLKPFLMLVADSFFLGCIAYALVQGSFSMTVNLTMCVISIFLYFAMRSYLIPFNKFLYFRLVKFFKKRFFSKLISFFLVGLVNISMYFVVVQVVTYICYFSGVREF